MHPYRTSPLLIRRRASRFIGEAHAATTGVNVALSLGSAKAGDLAIIVTDAGATPSGFSSAGATFAHNANGFVYSSYYRVLTQADITAGAVTVTGTSNGGLALLLVYRGGSTATVKSVANNNTSASLAIGGFTKAGNCKGVVTIGAASVASGGAITAPTGTVQRVAAFGGSVLSAAAAAFTPPSRYASGATVTWTGMSGNNGGAIIEIK